MGADLIGAFCRWPYRRSGANEAITPTPELDTAVLARFAAFIADVVDPDDAFPGVVFEDEDAWQDEAVSMVTELVSEAFGSARPPRDTDIFEIPEGHAWLYTAGMTWGDPPTDSFDVVGMLGASGITDTPFAL